MSASVEYALVLDSKGIREAVMERNPLKALNSFAIRDIIDGVDSPLIIMEASVRATIDVSAIFVKVGVSGGVTIRVEIDLFDPYPETSGGLVRSCSALERRICFFLSSYLESLRAIQVRPFELLALGR